MTKLPRILNLSNVTMKLVTRSVRRHMVTLPSGLTCILTPGSHVHVPVFKCYPTESGQQKSAFHSNSLYLSLRLALSHAFDARTNNGQAINARLQELKQHSPCNPSSFPRFCTITIINEEFLQMQRSTRTINGNCSRVRVYGSRMMQ